MDLHCFHRYLFWSVVLKGLREKKLDRAGVGVLFDKISVLTLSIQKDKSEQTV